MTCCIALKHNNEIWIGTDSRICRDSQIQTPKNGMKIVEFKTFVVAWAGIASLRGILKSLSTRNIKMKNELDAIKFSQTVWDKLLRLLDNSVTDAERPGINMDLIICTKDSIYHCDQFGLATEYEDFTAIGCGADIALGSLHTLFYNNLIKDPKKTIEEVLETVYNYDSACGGPVHIIKV